MFHKFIVILLPWPLKRFFLKKIFGYKIDKNSWIGFSWVYPTYLEMEEGAKIDHFNVAIHLDLLRMNKNSKIGRKNWITGLSINSNTIHFNHIKDRKAELLLGESSSITKNHHFDCSNRITIGKFSTIAGYNSQFLTHSIDLIENRQDAKEINIGEFTFVGTNVVVLGGSILPPKSILGAKSLLNKQFLKEWTLYGGTPAKEISYISKDAKYFSRKTGFVN